MHFLFHLLRKYPFSSFCIAVIWILSLVPFFPKTPLDNVEFVDKWIHILMYAGTFTVLWIEYIRKHQSPDYEKPDFIGQEVTGDRRYYNAYLTKCPFTSWPENRSADR